MFEEAGKGKRDTVDYGINIERVIEASLKVLLLKHIVMTEQSLEEVNEGVTSTKEYTVGDVKGGNTELRIYAVKVYIKERVFKPFD